MPDMSKLLNSGGKASDMLDDVNMADFTALIVGEKGVTLELLRATSEGNVPLPEQMAVIGHGRTSENDERRGGAGSTGENIIYLIGVRDHNDLPDFDIQRGDILKYKGIRYRCESLDTSVKGRVRAQMRGTGDAR